MYSQAKSELELLKEQVKELEQELKIAQKQIDELQLPCETLTQKMMIDRLKDNWDNLTLEDIEAICRI